MRDQAHLWSQSYERDLRDVLAIQTQVARAIAEEIEVTFERTGKRPIQSRASVQPEVYEAYLKGRYLLDRSTRPTLAIEYFQQAIAKDPSYAARLRRPCRCLRATRLGTIGADTV